MTLTIALAILGGLILAAVVAHGAWNTRRVQPRQADESSERIEPGMGGSEGAPGQPADTAPPLPEVPPLRRMALLDALIDAIAPLALDAPVSGEAVLAHWPATRRAGSKPYSIEGLDDEHGQWEQPRPGGRYTELQAGVQLANRSGALNEIEYSEFVQKVQAFADALNATPDFPDMLDVVARARELDAFASPLDAQLAINLRARKASWSVGFLQQCAQRLGFVPGAVAGRLVLPAAEDGAPPLLVLAFDANAALADQAQGAAVREATLSLDVPQTPAAAEPFPAWHGAATGLSEALDADMVDDAGAPLKLQSFASIGAELGQLYAALESHDLAAGSPAARRLFSG